MCTCVHDVMVVVPFLSSLYQLALKTVNGARSAFACFLFQRSFFHSYSDGKDGARGRRNEEEEEEEEEEERLKCKITIKVWR